MGICLVFVLPRARTQTLTEGHPLLGLLPEPSELAGWEKDGEAQFFDGDNLFIYIDGGAEIYLEYGFLRVLVQDYKSQVGNRLSLEIFEMKSPASAYGMFTFKRSSQGRPLDLGDEGQLADYYLNFCKGRYLVTITGLDALETATDGLLAVAQAVNSKLRDASDKPRLLSALTEEGLVLPSVKFFRGRLGVSNSEPVLAGLAAGLESGVKGDYVSGRSVFILEYPGQDSSQKKMAEAKALFSDPEKFADYLVLGQVLSCRDLKGRSIFAELEGNHLVFVIGKVSRDEARAEMTQVVARLRALLKTPSAQSLGSPAKETVCRRLLSR